MAHLFWFTWHKEMGRKRPSSLKYIVVTSKMSDGDPGRIQQSSTRFATGFVFNEVSLCVGSFH